MAHTYIPVSDVTPDGTVEEKLTWAYIDDEYDTWLELLAKEHWADWYFGTAWTDAWTPITIPSVVSYSSLSLWKNWLNLNLLTWNDMYLIDKIKWSDWVAVGTQYIYKSLTAPSTTYSGVSV